MSRRIRLHFRDVANDNEHRGFSGLTLAIRTDADAATEHLKEYIYKSVVQSGEAISLSQKFGRFADEQSLRVHICQQVHDYYRTWGHDVLHALADCLDYERYGLHGEDQKLVKVEFFNSRTLAESTVAVADKLVAAMPEYQGLPVFYVTMDVLICKPAHVDDAQWGEIAFSRIFSIDDASQLGYTARPGFASIEQQIDEICRKTQLLKNTHGRNVPVVLLEDNVRHAKMLNWVLEKFSRDRPLDIVGISTAFCCAPSAERQLIATKGQVLPLAAVIEYEQAEIDVITPRDLLFDGYVVSVDGEDARLPALFMDTKKFFKVSHANAGEFHDRAKRASIKFCADIESHFGVSPKLEWFSGAKAVSFLTGASVDMSMKEVLWKYSGENSISRRLRLDGSAVTPKAA